MLRSELDIEEADAPIDATLAHFAARGTPFRWHLGPSSRPDDSAARLQARGFRHADTLAGMCVPTERVVAQPDAAMAVSELAAGEEEEFVGVILSGFEVASARRASILRDVRGRHPCQAHFVARVGGQMVGVATHARMPRAGFLQGATVLEASRGRGIYGQLIQARLDALRRAGHVLAVITPGTATSAPICARLGFERVCTIEVYEHA